MQGAVLSLPQRGIRNADDAQQWLKKKAKNAGTNSIA